MRLSEEQSYKKDWPSFAKIKLGGNTNDYQDRT